jgi:hypothetical protein
MSDLIDVRVIGEPEVAAQAVARLGELFTLDRLNGLKGTETRDRRRSQRVS